MTNRQRLREAARLIAEVVDSLDMRVERCRCCNLDRHLNWPHKRLHASLSPMVDKLTQAAQSGAYQIDAAPKAERVPA